MTMQNEPRRSDADSISDELTQPAEIAVSSPLAQTSSATGLLFALEELDHLLQGAAAIVEATLGSDRPADRFRGLYVTHEDVERSLQGQPGTSGIFRSPLAEGEAELFDAADETRLGWLSHVFGLDSFDLNVLLLALAPEIDLKYERVYAFLQDNVTRTRPTVELALNLLCRSVEEKIHRIERFTEEGPLMRHGLVELIADPSIASPSLLAHFVKIDPQIRGFLLGLEGLDTRLAEYAQLSDPNAYLDELPLEQKAFEELSSLLESALGEGKPLRLYLRGPRGVGRTRVAEAIAGEAGMPLLAISTRRFLTGETELRRAIRLAFRQAWLSEAIPFWQDTDVLMEREDTGLLETVLAELREHGGISLLSGTRPWVPSPETSVGVVTVDLEPPGYAHRRAYWMSSSAEAGMVLTESEIDLLASRFGLTLAQIDEAVSVARQRTGRLPADHRAVLEHVLAAARAQTGHDLAKLTRRIVPVYRRADIVLPEETMRRFDEICIRISARHTVLDAWGWDAKLSLGKGTSVLFSGPSGCGKTMAAEIIAAELGLELFRIDLATVVDKYIGETEKKLEKIFEAAEASNSVLLFDEADALFGKRSEVRDSHDRYANVEIAYLLQKIEEYDGLAILATNLPQNIDEAFTRRLTFIVRFPAPDERNRRLIWEKIWPAQTPLGQDVDLDFLAREYRLTGGNIKNIAMAASFYAAEDDTPVTMAHVLRATRREFEQMGKLVATKGSVSGLGDGSIAAPAGLTDLSA